METLTYLHLLEPDEPFINRPLPPQQCNWGRNQKCNQERDQERDQGRSPQAQPAQSLPPQPQLPFPENSDNPDFNYPTAWMML